MKHTYHDGAVLGAAGDDLVIMGTPVDVQHRSRVATHCGVGLVNPACLKGETRKRAVTCRQHRAHLGAEDGASSFSVTPAALTES